jgi:hypothetical protein
MRRVAANRVYFSTNKAYNNHVIEIIDKTVVNHYQLHDELELTEWLGGIIIIAQEPTIAQFIENMQDKGPSPQHLDDILKDVYERGNTESNGIKSYSAIHIKGIDISTGKNLDKIKITQLHEHF